MKKVSLCVLLFSLCLSSGTWASAVCAGSACCNTGANRDYLYTIDEGTAEFSVFILGTCDGNEANYSDWVMPTGWTWEFQAAEAPDSAYTPKGSYASATGNCPWIILWQSDSAEHAVTSATFGFNNANAPHNVSWAVADSSMDAIEGGDWDAAVALGSGPLHAPSVPEPSAIFALVTGLIGFVGLKSRSKR